MNEKKHRGKGLAFLMSLIGAILLYCLFMFVANLICNYNLRKYIDSFEPVEYSENRLTPIMEDGHFTFVTDDEFRIMHLTDIHIGGGLYSYKRDKKAIYEVISMLQAEKPDLVILSGDNTYCLPKTGYNGGGCFNNKRVAKTFIHIFNHETVYFSTVFGNHDTESFDFASRQEIADLYMDNQKEYCVFNEEFTDSDAKTVPSVSNQFIVVRKSDGEITKLLLLIDSNAYESTSLLSSILGKYDVIHEEQIDWAKNVISDMSEKAGLPEGEELKAIAFMHIPVGEYKAAHDDLILTTVGDDGKVSYSEKMPSSDTEYIEGSWGEEKICYGGLKRTDITPSEQDLFFEELCDGDKPVEAIFCGHDHLNNAVVLYRGVMLNYSYSVDNIAYGNEISNSGLQRGATVIALHPDKTFSVSHKNAYKDYGVSVDKFLPVYLDHVMWGKWYRTVENQG